jgi:hypothetical protein
MASIFNQLLAGLSGGAQGYAQDQDRQLQQARQAANDRYLNEDRSSQRALRDAQAAQERQRQQQYAYLRTPEFAGKLQAANAGDEAAKAHVMGAIAGLPDAATYSRGIERESKKVYDPERAVVVDTDAGTATPLPGMTARPKAPVVGSPEWKQSKIDEAQIGAKYGYHAPPGNVVVTGIGADGKPTIFSGKNRGDLNLHDTGVSKPVSGAAGALAAPVAFRVGQAGEMLKKAADIFPMLDQLRVGLSQSSAADIANNGVGIAGMHIPGTKGVGNMMMNNDPKFATYQAALGPFAIAAAHANAGLRVSDAQMAKIQKNIEVLAGDIANPTVMAMKKKNVVDLMNSIVGSLPPDAVAAQEDQMDPSTLAMLRDAGYRGARRVAPAGSSGNVNLGDSKPPLSEVDKAHAARDPQFAAWLKTQGYE